MTLWIRAWLRHFEVDRAVFYGLVGRGWNVLSGPITVILIASRFTPELQGYYYTFNSLLGLQAFVELGLTTVVMQFASHEWAHLSLHPETGSIVGDADAMSRLVSLGRFAFGWFGTATVLFVVALGFGGYVFFSQTTSHGIGWVAPWILLCVASGANLFLLPAFSLLEGCDQISVVYGYRTLQMIVGNAVVWTAMLLGAGLWTAPAFQIANLVMALTFLTWRYRGFFTPFFHRAMGLTVNWRTDMLPMQWRLAVGYLVSYFTLSVFTPLIFHYQGPAAAGQMGLTLTLVMTVGSVAALWSATRAPRFGVLIAKRAYDELDSLFRRVLMRAEVVLFGAAVCAWLAVYAVNILGYPLARRLLPPVPTALLLMGMVAANICGPMAVYLRAHKREPYVGLSVAVALLTGGLAWLMAMRVGPLGVAAAYLAISALVALPGGLFIFIRRRREWHAA